MMNTTLPVVENTSPNLNVLSSSIMMSLNGQECYQRAMDLLQQEKEFKKEQEKTQAQQQYEAMQKVMSNPTKHSNNNSTSNPPSASTNRKEKDASSSSFSQQEARKSNRRAGVAVVKTIAKQSRTNRANSVNVNVERSIALDTGRQPLQTSQSLQEEARRYMIVAGLVHGYGKALVRLGNEALELSRTNPSKEVVDAYNYDFLEESIVSDMMKDSVVARIDKVRSKSHVEKARYFYEWAGENGSPEGYFNLGHLLWNEEDKNVSQAMLAFQNAVELDDADAMYFVGVQFINCCQEDSPLHNLSKEFSLNQETRQRGLKLIQRAAQDYDHGGAWYYLTVFYRNGDGDLNIIPCTDEIFKQNLDRACSIGDVDGLFLRGHCHYHGEDGHDQNYSRSLDDFLRSGDAGNPDGYVSAAAMLHRGGFGTVAKNQRRAFDLYQKAAEMGSEDGWKNVIACYALGEGVPKCERTAKHIARTMLKQE